MRETKNLFCPQINVLNSWRRKSLNQPDCRGSMRSLQAVLSMFFLLISVGYSEIHYLRIPSNALVDSTNIIIATPSDFNVKHPGGYPFILMLHGWDGDQTQWAKDADLQSLADEHDMLLILPDGGYDGWWQDTDLLPGRNYDTHIHQELKSWVISNFNGSSNTARHGVMGLSMGGYGAFLQVFLHPEDYAAASALSGVMDLSERTEKWGLKLALGDYKENEARWRARNPVDMVNTLDAGVIPPLQLICGRDDFVFTDNKVMANRLKAGGFSIEFLEEEGRHSHDFWKTHVNTSIAFLVSHFGD